jgi:hypothetical protein
MTTEVQQQPQPQQIHQASQYPSTVTPSQSNYIYTVPFAMFPTNSQPSQMRPAPSSAAHSNLPIPSTHPPMPQPPPDALPHSAASPATPATPATPSPPAAQTPSPADAYAHWLTTTPAPPPLAHNARRPRPEEFAPVSPSPQGLPVSINYTIAQLKQLASDHRQRRSGTKAVLRGRLHAVLVRSWHATQIQRTFRGHLVRRLLRAKGLDGPRRPAHSANDTELITLDPVDSIPFADLVNVPNVGGVATLYTASTLQKHMLCQLQRGCDPCDPYTNTPYAKDVAVRMQEEERLARLVGVRTAKSVVGVLRLGDERRTHTHRVVSLCSHLDTLGHTTDPSWFLGLDSGHWRRLCSELADIWSYRARLDNLTRRRIAGTWPIAIPQADWSHAEIRSSGMDQLERLAYRGVDREAQALGAYYALIALTMVSDSAAMALPWLHEAGRLT